MHNIVHSFIKRNVICARAWNHSYKFFVIISDSSSFKHQHVTSMHKKRNILRTRNIANTLNRINGEIKGDIFAFIDSFENHIYLLWDINKKKHWQNWLNDCLLSCFSGVCVHSQFMQYMCLLFSHLSTTFFYVIFNVQHLAELLFHFALLSLFELIR